jgi:hypothetical protein
MCVFFVTLLGAATPHGVFAEGSAADGPWTGQASCVLSTRGTNYQEDQTHTWRLSGEPPRVTGSIRHWPAVWSVDGNGSRSSIRSIRGSEAAASAPAQRWTINVPETVAPIAIWEDPSTNRLRIGNQHGLLVATGIAVRTDSRQDLTYSLQEWTFPATDDVVTNTSIAGSRTRTLPAGPATTWQPPPQSITTETCTWNFTRSPSGKTGSRAAGTISLNASGAPAGTATLDNARATAANTLVRATGTGGSAANIAGVPVSGLRAQSTFTSISLRWTCPQGASGYEVFGAPKGQPLVKLTSSPIGPNCVQDLTLSNPVMLNPGQPGLTPQPTYSTGFTHDGLPTAKEFTYTVRALYPNSGPADSPPLSASTGLFPAPGAASAQTGGPGLVYLRWGRSQTPAGDATGYVISRKLAGEAAFRTIATVPPIIPYMYDYTDGGVPAGRHEYTIKAVDGEPTGVLTVMAGVPDLWNTSVLNLAEVDLGWTVWPGTPIRLMSSSLAAGPWTDVGANLAPGQTHLRFLATSGSRTYYKVVASHPTVTLESAPKLLEVPAWHPIINLRAQAVQNGVDLRWDCEPGIVEYHVIRVWNGGSEYVHIPVNVYPGLCVLNDRGIPPQATIAATTPRVRRG